MPAETSFRNARIVLADEIVEGSLNAADGRIAAFDAGGGSVGEDFDGDFLVPGLVELHTDHLEGHYAPRPGVRWNALAAVQAHDAQIAASGITTVFDCLRMGSEGTDGFAEGEMRELANAIGQAQREDRLRAEHFIHLRCEVSTPDVMTDFESFRAEERVRLASLMDHAPGQRQFQTMGQYELYYKTKRGLSDEAFARYVAMRQEQSARFSAVHRKAIAEHCRANGVTLASHDDATLDHVGEALDDGVRLAEFPTSLEAARASHEAGMSVLMGAPNIVRGGSHSGNIAARDLAEAGLLDVLSETAATTTMMFMVLIGALIFSNFVNVAGLPTALQGLVQASDLPAPAILAIVLAMYLALGMVLESLSMVLLTVPILAPLMAGLGYDLIWFGIVVVVVTEISLITPPVGLNVFVLKTVLPDVPIGTIFRGIGPFLAADVVRLAIIALLPGVVLFLPSLM